LREKAAGQKCEFHVEYKVNDRECGTLFVDGQNLNLALAGSGYVRVMEKKSENSLVSQWHAEYEAAAAEV